MKLILYPVLCHYLLATFAVSASEVPKERRQEIRRNIVQTRLKKLKVPDGYQRRKQLPKKQLFGGEITPLECEATYSVAEEGYVYFNLGPGPKKCHNALLGSKNDDCTVAVYCNGQINLEPGSSRGCEKEYLILSDGTEGLLSGCGKFSFGTTPRYRRNGGRDIYIFTKGNAKSAQCIAYCMEDMRPGQYGLKPPQKIDKNQGHIGPWQDTQCQCGIRRDDGKPGKNQDVIPNEFPWIAALVYAGTREAFCTGTLVNDRFILTAGHCFEHESLKAEEVEVLLHAKVLDGAGDESSPKISKVPGWKLPKETDESEMSIRRKVAEIRIHPMFDEETLDYDLAILMLAQPVNLVHSHVAPICLPKVDEMIPYQDDVTMTVAGWGLPWEDAPAMSRILQKLNMPYMNRRSCRLYAQPTDRHICAGYLEGGQDVCLGNSGAPMIYLANPTLNQYILAGVTSAGAGCAKEAKMGMYTDVREVVQWMYFHMPGAVWCPR